MVVEAQPGIDYSGKLIRRLTNVFDSSQIQLVGGELGGQKARARYTMPFLPACPLQPEDSLERVASFNTVLPEVTSSLLFARNNLFSREGYVEGLGGYDVCNLPALAVMLAQKNEVRTTETAFRVVYGATKTMPLRALSYMLPSLILMEQLRSDGVDIPQLQIIFANNISGRLDAIDLARAKEESRKFAQLATAYVEGFFPQGKSSTVFLEDTPLDKGSRLRKEMIEVARVIAGHDDIKKELREKGKNNGSLHTYLFYGAAHLLVHDADLSDSLIPINQEQPDAVSPNVIISFGGVQEKFFYELRHKIKPFLGNEYKKAETLQYFTKHRVPPYYMARDGDLSLDDGIFGRSGRIGKAAAYDIDYLSDISNRRGDFEDFLQSMRGKIL